MNVLFLAPRFPLPADTGGKIRTWNILKQVSRFASVHLVCFSFNASDHEQVKILEKLNIKVSFVPARSANFIEKTWKICAARNPFSVEKYRVDAMTQTIKDLVKKERFDLVHFDHVHMGQYREIFNFDGEGSPGHQVTGSPDRPPDIRHQAPGRVPLILDEHNVEFKILERCAEIERNPVNRLIYSQQARKMKQFEKTMLTRFNICTAVSDDDAGVLRELTGGKVRIEVVPNGVDVEYFRAPEHQNTSAPSEIPGTLVPRCAGNPSGEDALVFTGSMDWLPNEDAVVYFIKEILPLIWERKPQMKFYVVGKSPSGAIQNARKGDQRIVITGSVEDVRVYMRRAKAFVASLRIGGGTRLKILEAMAMGMPVVATSVGAEGITYSDGQNIVIADSPSLFAQKVVELLNGPMKAQKIGEEGRQLVLEKYDWKIIGKKIEEIYSNILKYIEMH